MNIELILKHRNRIMAIAAFGIMVTISYLVSNDSTQQYLGNMLTISYWFPLLCGTTREGCRFDTLAQLSLSI